MADDGPTSPADSPAYQHSDDGSTPVPVASTIPSQDTASVEETALGRSKTPVCYTSTFWKGRKTVLDQRLQPPRTATPTCYTNRRNGPQHRPHGHSIVGAQILPV